MASKSTKSKITESPTASRSDSPDSRPFYFCIDHLYGIKMMELWKTSPLYRTHYILPEMPTNYRLIDDYVTRGDIHPEAMDYEEFWFELSDVFKDRYLLVNYMAVYDFVIRRMADYRGLYATEIKELWNEKMTQISKYIRGFVMEKNMKEFHRDDGALMLLVNIYDSHVVADVFRRQVRLMTSAIVNEMETTTDPNMRAVLKLVENRLSSWFCMLSRLFLGFAKMYFIWVSYDAQNLRHYTDFLEHKGMPMINVSDGESRLTDRIEFMRKLKLAAPRWSREDRRLILDAIETDGKSCRGTYVQILLKEVGVEKFKKLAFGKHRFCAHCHRSSYTGEDRLLACKRCDTEGVRPRAWYCDRQCQKADWRQHRASKHPPMVVEEEKASRKKKKKRKPRKK